MFDSRILHRSGIGFDVVDEIINSLSTIQNSSSYPPYNIQKTGNTDYKIVVAVAGFSESDLTIQKDKDLLLIESHHEKTKSSEETQYLHKGIALRDFKLTFKLAELVDVVDAELKDGLLTVSFVKHIPDEAPAQKIKINTTKPQLLKG